jgi:hypothetical protein
MVEVLSLRKTNTHNARRNGLGVVVSTALLGEPLRDLAVTEALLAHFKDELIIGVQVCSHTLVILNSHHPALFTKAWRQSVHCQ